MTNITPILFACYMHFTADYSPVKAYEDRAYWGSLVFFLAMMDLLYGNEILPKKWFRKAKLFRTLLETICVYLIAEIPVALFWIKLEGTIDIFLRLAAGIDGNRYVELEAITVGLGLFYWTTIVSQATHEEYRLHKALFRTCGMLLESFKELLDSFDKPKVRTTKIKAILRSSKNKCQCQCQGSGREH
ncbi:GL15770 [Drosophila persimilis]|uniref:GL15770 n=1 Tax=Drosophila persimilis TaxID=7234 RepID=B4GQ72_DROPE|nr:uncharacterized protein LOC6595715 [Drosophila persimilis]EDW39744.1 GL15770 [Drosophila persimilis]